MSKSRIVSSRESPPRLGRVRLTSAVGPGYQGRSEARDQRTARADAWTRHIRGRCPAEPRTDLRPLPAAVEQACRRRAPFGFECVYSVFTVSVVSAYMHFVFTRGANPTVRRRAIFTHIDNGCPRCVCAFHMGRDCFVHVECK